MHGFAALALIGRGCFVLRLLIGVGLPYIAPMNWRPVIAAVLSLVMVITSGAMAVARGQAYDAAGQILLCTGHGAVIVTVNADGEPIEAPHFCPDCVVTAVADTAVPPVAPPVALRVEPAVSLPVQQHSHQAPDGFAQARAPPAV